MLGSAESYFQAFAVFLKATVFQVGIVYTVPMFAATLIQLHASSLLRWFRSRKNLTVLSGALRSLLFVPLILVYYMGVARVWVLLGLICLYFALNYLPVPAWTSWMRDLVDENRRGSYFSRRNRISNLVALLGIIAAGLILEYFKVRPFLGFALIFSVALLGSIGSTIFLSLKYDVPYTEAPPDREGFFRFSLRMFHSNYGRFVLYNFSLYLTVFFSGPFFVPYMLKDLGFSYADAVGRAGRSLRQQEDPGPLIAVHRDPAANVDRKPQLLVDLPDPGRQRPGLVRIRHIRTQLRLRRVALGEGDPPYLVPDLL